MGTMHAMIPEPVTASAAVLTQKDVAGMLNLSRDTLRAMQLSHDGPAYTCEQGRIRYTREAVREFQVQRHEAHEGLMNSYRVRSAPDARRDTVPALAGFASRIPERRSVASIGNNGLFCRVGKGPVMLTKLGRAWCRLAHRQISRPVRGEYICLECLRRFSVNWHDVPAGSLTDCSASSTGPDITLRYAEE